MKVTKILAERHTRNPRVAAYIRVSTTEKKQDESYEAQAVVRTLRTRSGTPRAGTLRASTARGNQGLMPRTAMTSTA